MSAIDVILGSVNTKYRGIYMIIKHRRWIPYLNTTTAGMIIRAEILFGVQSAAGQKTVKKLLVRVIQKI